MSFYLASGDHAIQLTHVEKHFCFAYPECTEPHNKVPTCAWDTKKIPETLSCTVHLLCSQNRAPPTYLHHFFLDTVVGGFSFWLYISLESRTKGLLINQPKRNLLQGHFKNYQLQSPLAKYARVNIICPLNTDPPTPPISSKVWKCMRQWGRKRCKQGEEVTGQLYFLLRQSSGCGERDFNSHSCFEILITLHFLDKKYYANWESRRKEEYASLF